VVTGVSDQFAAKLNDPDALSLVAVGTIITKGDTFGTMEGSKLTADLSSPVSGTVIDINTRLLDKATIKSVFLTGVADPYGQGWMIAVRISNPAELKDLLTPDEYLKLAAGVDIY
jgi:glycine cleavage system H protein